LYLEERAAIVNMGRHRPQVNGSVLQNPRLGRRSLAGCAFSRVAVLAVCCSVQMTWQSQNHFGIRQRKESKTSGDRNAELELSCFPHIQPLPLDMSPRSQGRSLLTFTLGSGLVGSWLAFTGCCPNLVTVVVGAVVVS
jgi:hypothetical protein